VVFERVQEVTKALEEKHAKLIRRLEARVKELENQK
jgi:hypothetical protein